MYFERMMEELISQFDPKEVWIYGSCAKGDPRWDSDVDLMIVREQRQGVEHPTFEARLLVSHAKGPLPVDLMVVTPEDWEKERTSPQGVFIDVVENGVRVYAWGHS